MLRFVLQSSFKTACKLGRYASRLFSKIITELSALKLDPHAGNTLLGEGPHFEYSSRSRSLYFCDLWGRKAIRVKDNREVSSVTVKT